MTPDEILRGLSVKPAILDVAAIPSGAEHLLEVSREYEVRLRELARRPGIDPAHVHFVLRDDHSFNAVAGSDPSLAHHVVAVNLGAVLLLHDVAHAALAHPGLLVGIGNAAAETTGEFQFARDIDDLAADDSTTIGIPQRFPVDPEREAYARLLGRLSLDFIFLHETTHVLAGHTRYQRDLGRGLPLFQAMSSRPLADEATALRLHALETDADWFAFRILVSLAIREDGVTASFDGLELDMQQRIRAATLAVFLVLMYSDEAASDWQACFTRDHPHPLVRQVALDPILRHQACQLDGISEAEVVGGFMRAVADAVAIGHRLRVPAALSGFTPAVGSAIEEWLERIVRTQEDSRMYMASQRWDARLD